MNAARFHELKAGAAPRDDAERAELDRALAGERRSQAARRAVLTKRRKYPTWPSRANTHRAAPPA
jgi:hypothetical protein